ncbi:MAG TPA: RDD family protein [Chloroflexi bacterium]|jgi:uncharacterized RDD family membrane protein YckC|nr:RDD family protein [Chloroflexota bacterium]
MKTPEGASYAGLGPRLAALAVDGLLLCGVFFPITRLVKGVWLMSATDHRWVSGLFITDPLCIAFLIAMFAYFSLAEGLTGATVGKRAMGLRVVRPDGGRPGLKRGAFRNLLRFIDGLPAFNIIGIVTIVRSPECARIGDRIADTRVVRVRQRHGAKRRTL